MAPQLQPGSCALLLQGMNTKVDVVVQVIGKERVAIRRIPLEAEEWRLHISDGQYSLLVMLDSNMNHVLADLVENGFLSVKEVVRREMSGRRITLLTRVYIVPTVGEQEKIGVPVPLNILVTAVMAQGPGIATPVAALPSSAARGWPAPNLSRPSIAPAPNAGRGSIPPTPHAGRGSIPPTPHAGRGSIPPTPHARRGSIPPSASRGADAARGEARSPSSAQRQRDATRTEEGAGEVAASLSKLSVAPKRPLMGLSKKSTSKVPGASTSKPSAFQTVNSLLTKTFGRRTEYPTGIAEDNLRHVMLDVLSPGMEPDWFVKVRVVEHSGRNRWESAESSGIKLQLSVVDKDENKMRVVTFDPSIIDLFVREVRVGQLMYFWCVKIIATNPTFQHVGFCMNEMILKPGAGYELLESDDRDIPGVVWTFTNVKNIQALGPDSRVDLIAVILHVGKYESIRDEDGSERNRREVQLVDKTNYVIRLVIWEERARAFSGKDNDVIALKNVVTTKYGGASLNVFVETSYLLNPKGVPGFDVLKKCAGSVMDPNVLPRSFALSIDVVRKGDFGKGARVDTVNVIATIRHANKDCIYQACTHAGCNRKLNERYVCPMPAHNPQNPKHKRFCYLFNLRIGSETWKEQVKILAFDGAADMLLGMTANKAARAGWRRQCDTAVDELIGTTWWFTVQCRTKVLYGNNNPQWSVTVIGAARLDVDGTVIVADPYERTSDDELQRVDSPEEDEDED
ncbi:hypothetical protein CALVIDRAFT_531034 [Calocera viscosa TUFC12733]|uniref:Replication protein A subunit n=1 Tax=Calocera viscosa (strain TUFC12733) TaxID=1330018 RepID=A0A167H1Q2_CALVF|nr:hypothetical protein CALVIDRAFT_531034 [Calocera viscosa TUFC12733]